MTGNVISRAIVLRPLRPKSVGVGSFQDSLEHLAPIQALIDAVDSSTATKEMADDAQAAVLALTADLAAAELPPPPPPAARVDHSSIFLGLGIGLTLAAIAFVTLDGSKVRAHG